MYLNSPQQKVLIMGDIIFCSIGSIVLSKEIILENHDTPNAIMIIVRLIDNDIITIRN